MASQPSKCVAAPRTRVEQGSVAYVLRHALPCTITARHGLQFNSWEKCTTPLIHQPCCCSCRQAAPNHGPTMRLMLISMTVAHYYACARVICVQNIASPASEARSPCSQTNFLNRFLPQNIMVQALPPALWGNPPRGPPQLRESIICLHGGRKRAVAGGGQVHPNK